MSNEVCCEKDTSKSVPVATHDSLIVDTLVLSKYYNFLWLIEGTKLHSNLREECPSGPASSISFNEVKHGCAR